jgi:catechol 2,3-dioxygenase-like lactoylglutathione lyase family enzyme
MQKDFYNTICQEETFLLIFNPVSRLSRERESPIGQEHSMMVGAATVFVVRDITKSIEHYRDALGFSVTFQHGNPTFYACLCRDEVALHLLAAHETKRLPGNGGICVFVKDVDRVHADLTSRGANVIKAPQNYDYGMRDFDVVDPDGNHLTFGIESLSPS